MRQIVNASQMKNADLNTIQNLGIPSMVLMERAALQVVQEINKRFNDKKRVLVVCGSGNNGGDGLAIARILLEQGNEVDISFVGKMDSRTEETVQQMKILENMEVTIGNSLPKREYSVIIDAMFGIGLSRPVQGIYQTFIDEMNSYDAYKVAVDIASGISADTGQVLGTAFCADLTVTFEYEKLGHKLYPGAMYSGEVVVCPIGIHNSIVDNLDSFFTLDEHDYYQMLPKRKADSHKGSYGKVLIIAGSHGMAGAAFLSAKAAYLTGAGLVRIFTAESNRQILQQLLPEAIITTYNSNETELISELKNQLEWADVICVGCGLGTSSTSKLIMNTIVDYNEKPCVIDADGLNVFAKLLQNDISLKEGSSYVFTPHMGEMCRLTGCEMSELKNNRISILKEFTNKYHVVCVLKDSRTMVAESFKKIYLNCNGNAAMAKAGSGDVLSGIITGFLAQGVDAYNSAILGVYTHGSAGDISKDKHGEYSVLAEDILDGIRGTLKKFGGE